MRSLISILVLGAVGACSTLPDIPSPPLSVDRSATYPTFAPLDQILNASLAAEERAAETEADVTARVASLRGRAAQLRAASPD